MTQTRLHITLPRASSARAFAAIEAEFEDDGLPISLFELDGPDQHDELSIYVDGQTEPAKARFRACLAEVDIDPSIEGEVLPDIDWVAKTLEGLKPVRAGRFLVHGAHDRDKRRIGDLAIEIEAGLAFGTGHHGTTAGCMEMIDRVRRRERPRNALDLGTGSAVLAIALARTARIPVLATDIDPVAVKVARTNIALNHVASLVRAASAAGFHNPLFRSAGPFDLVVANILAQPLMRLAPEMARHVAPGGSAILSGILDGQRRSVMAAYVAQGFRHLRTLHRDGWTTMHLKR